MAITYNLISKQTLSSNASTVTFSSIPQTYTDLKFLVSAQSNGTGNNADNFFFNVNGITSGYGNKFFYGSHTTLTSATNSNNLTNTTQAGAVPLPASSAWGNTELYIPNYTNSSTKAYTADAVAEINSNVLYENYLHLVAGTLPTTSGITSVTFKFLSVDIVSGSTFYLYGIKNS
jgi:hypothetical protein